MNDLAPIVIFAYRRPEKLSVLLNSLSACPEASVSELTVFVDGPKNAREEKAVNQVLAVASAENRFGSTRVVAQPSNRGLSSAVIGGVNEMLQVHDRVIVLEDDLMVSPHFLTFMNQGLSTYAETDEVVSIHAYVYPVQGELPATFFVKGADCWGWATWRRGWAVFNPDGRELLDQLVKTDRLNEFNFGGSEDYVGLLQNQIGGRVDSWAVRWYASALLADKFTLYPANPMAVNTGIDGSGTHGGSRHHRQVLATEPIAVTWQEVQENPSARAAFERFFRMTSQHDKRFDRKIRRWLKRLVTVRRGVQ